MSPVSTVRRKQIINTIPENCGSAQQEKPYLLVALRVQKCWAEMMLNCKALRAMGVENVAYVFLFFFANLLWIGIGIK